MTTSNNGFHTAREAAPVYLSLGLAPVPLPYRSKNPGFDGWQGFRLQSETIDQHFPPDTQKGIGVLNGAPSRNQVDIDLDSPEALRAAVHLLPRTGWIFGRKTSPKSHWIYRTEAPFDKEKKQFLDPTDLKCLCEMRGTGGHTVFPPTHHKDTGEELVWESFTDAPATGSLEQLTRCVQDVAVVALLARHWPAHGWHNATLALAGGLLRGVLGSDGKRGPGLPVKRVQRIVKALWLTAGTNDDPSDREGCIESTAENLKAGEECVGWTKLASYLGGRGPQIIWEVKFFLDHYDAPKDPAKAAPKKRKPPLPYKSFPTEALPEPHRTFVTQVAASLGCDPAYAALPALAAIASLIGNSRTVLIKRDWQEPCVLWTGIVGDSGTLKSPAQKKVTDHIFAIQGKDIKQHKEAMVQFEIDLATWEKAKKKDASAAGERPEKPTCARLICSDVTVERLAGLLGENPRGLLVSRDELGGWLGSFNQYKARGGSDLAAWLSMHRAEPLIVDRKTGDKPLVYVPRAAVSICGGIQGGTLARALTPEYVEAGLAARVLFAMPPKIRKEWREVEIHPEVADAFEKSLHQLIALTPDTTDDDEPIPFRVKLSPEAKCRWISFYTEWAAEQEHVDGALASCLSKLEGYAARFALIHHVVTHLGDQSDCDPIEPVSIEAGITLARWFGSEAKRIYTMLAESEDDLAVRRLYDFIRARGGELSVRDLMRANCRKYPDADASEAALTTLVESGLAQWIEMPTRKRGAAPLKGVKLCMTHDQYDQSDDDDAGDGGLDEGGAHDQSDDVTPDDDGGPPRQPQPTPGQYSTCADADHAGSKSTGHTGHASCTDTGNFPIDSETGLSLATGHAGQTELVMQSAPYQLVTRPADLGTVAAAIDDSPLVGLDIETTGLNSRTDRVRLLSLACDTIDGGTSTYLVDCFAVDPSPLWDVLRDRTVIAHNASFDLSFLHRLGFEAGEVRDTMLMSQLLTAGTRQGNDLAECVRRELGRELAKEEQTSDWSRSVLSEEQLRYAALDAAELRPLYDVLSKKLDAAKLAQVATIEHACLPAMLWLARSGVPFDLGGWKALTAEAQEEAHRLGQELDAAAVPPEQGDLMGGGWNWDSPAQVRDAFAALGFELKSTDDDALAAVDHPVAGLLRKYRAARKRCTTYGTDFGKKHLASDGRVYAGWRQIGADSGRMSCRKPSLQNLPRDKRYRQCFRPADGRVMVKADYSQIELRIAAKVSGDPAMLSAYRQGLDLHTLTAQRILGKADVSKADRQLAKALNFGLLYGMGVKGFQQYSHGNYGVVLSETEAKQYRDAFFEAYPGLAAWHRQVQRTKPKETRTLTGRRRRYPEPESSFTEQVNTPVQGTGADGLKLAMVLLWERREQLAGAFPVMAVHDEIVLECAADQAENVAAILKQTMIDAMAPLISPVPVEVEVTVAPTWGG